MLNALGEFLPLFKRRLKNDPRDLLPMLVEEDEDVDEGFEPTLLICFGTTSGVFGAACELESGGDGAFCSSSPVSEERLERQAASDI